ncbi:50S ribosomal protein L11 methyltransferase [Parerythrobacter jejuensis]|uniref:Ribosomal protein L11 methyltransferase n=1 Tax=Parerythrobacter jejuensis TaxID=795812 RepID=A0A845B0P4_9SPHN|nr:50S ribosomal protein L11 methyltransferase [Parerythrobacter jejuensis]MXP32558.1 methyltransferase [Parerythrobacter jejuensis]
MSTSWKITAFAPKPAVQAALLAQDAIEDWDYDLVISGSEVAEDTPDDWVLEAWFPRKPGKAQQNALKNLFEGTPPEFQVEKLPDQDWVTLSQLGVDPIRAGRFHVHTPEHDADPAPGVVNFAIPASQAFGTGQHETTAACLAMLDRMKQQGVVARNIADIGTGTGLLAFGALALWPRAVATASDIDAVCVPVVEENCRQNGIRLGSGRGSLTMVVAAGTDHPLIHARGPYDLLIANILAGPLIALASDFAAQVPSGGNLLLAGLLETQERDVRRAYRMAGFRLSHRIINGDWSILWLRKRP